MVKLRCRGNHRANNRVPGPIAASGPPPDHTPGAGTAGKGAGRRALVSACQQITLMHLTEVPRPGCHESWVHEERRRYALSPEVIGW